MVPRVGIGCTHDPEVARAAHLVISGRRRTRQAVLCNCRAVGSRTVGRRGEAVAVGPLASCDHLASAQQNTNTQEL